MGEGAGSRRLLLLAALAIFITVLNALKPIEVDDAVFIQNAAQIARHPLDPYGFTVFWFQWPEPAIWELCPPVLPYWIALGMKLLGPSPLLWKLWLFPWIATFVFGLHALFRRFCPGVELPLTILTALSPEFLPGINLMFDVPALALGLLALNLLMTAVDDAPHFRWKQLMLAGVFAGLAMQTKFTALTIPAVFCTYAALRKRTMTGVLAASVAAALFVAWEAFDYRRYGVSHFLFNLRANDTLKGIPSPLWEARSVVTLAGGLATDVAALALLGLGAPLWSLLLLLCCTAAGFALLFCGALPAAVFLTLGSIDVILFLAATAHLLRPNHARPSDHASHTPQATAASTAASTADRRFLVLWLLIELAACLAISPFPAARRLMGILLVLTVIGGALVARAARAARPARRRLWALAGVAALAGLACQWLDYRDAAAHRLAVDSAAAQIHALRQPGQTVWFTGRGGIDYAARQQGFVPVVPDQSRLHAGDWVVSVSAGVVTQRTGFAASVVNLVRQVEIRDRIPVSFLPCYYAGSYPFLPLRGPRVAIDLYQVTRAFVPPTTLPGDQVLDWAARRGEPLPPASVPAVLRAVADHSSSVSAAVRTAALHAASVRPPGQ